MGNYQTTALLGDTNKFFIPWLIPRNDRNSIFSPNIFGKLASRTKRNNDEQGKFSYTNVLFMSYSTLDKVSKLVPNLEYLFSFNFQLKNAATKFCFWGHLHAIKVP